MKNCRFCQGAVESTHIEHVHRWQGRLYILRNVPVEVCNQCGEVYFTPQALKSMDAIVMGKEEPQEYREVPVYTL